MTGFVNKSRVLWGQHCFLWIALLLICIVPNVNSATLWYGGDINAGSSAFNNTLLVAQNGAGIGDTVLTEFVVTDPNGWHVTGLFSNNIADYPFGNYPFDKAVWSIRTGTGINEPGNTIFAGLSTAIIKPTGRFWGDDIEYNVMVAGLEIKLAPGVYTMNVSPLAPEQIYYVGDSNGINAVGKRGLNGSFQDESFNVNGVVERNVKNFPNRVSMGIIGSGSTIDAEVPLPSSALLFIWGLLSIFLFKSVRRNKWNTRRA